MSDGNALQFHYTSCRHGLSGYAGFQTRAESAGLQLQERRELERWGLYQPPRNLPREPDADTISALFPQAFKVVRLSSGRTALIHSTYTGQDYSGRWGNYFSHGLVLEGPLVDRWPIDAYAWHGWVRGLGDGGDDTEPGPLPKVPLSDITGGSGFEFEELGIFLQEGEGRPGALAQMIQAVFLRGANSRNLLIRELLELDAVYWIACIQKAFPPGCQRELTCSTFQFDPRHSPAINATIGETDFLFDESERRYQFQVFDFVTGRHSEVPDDYPEYAGVVAEWMASDPMRIRDFHDFAALFDCHDIGSELLMLLRLFRMERGEQIPLSSLDFGAIPGFADTRSRPAAVTRVLGAVGATLQNADSAASPEEWAPVIRFIAGEAAASGDPAHRQLACRAWVDAFDHLVVRKHLGSDAMAVLRDEVVKVPGLAPCDLARAFLSDAHLGWLQEHAGGLPPTVLGVVMTEVERSCRDLGCTKTYEAREVLGLIDAVLRHNPGRPPDLQWAFSPYRLQVDGLLNIVVHIASVLEKQILDGGDRDPGAMGEACRAVGRSLAPVTDAAGDRLRFELLNRLKADWRLSGVVIGEWEAAIQRATDRIEAHAIYERNVLADGSESALKLRDEMAPALLMVLPPEHQQQQALDWVKSGRCRRLSSDRAAGIVLKLAAQGVKLAPGDDASEDLAGRIRDELEARGLRLEPDRLGLRAAARRALSGPDGIDGLQDLLREADTGSYVEFVDATLPRLLAEARSQERHQKVLEMMAVDTHMQAFAAAYDAFLRHRPGNCFDHVDVAALLFWLHLDESDPCWTALGRMKDSALEALATRFGAMEGKPRAQARERLVKLPALKDPGLKDELEAFLALAGKRRPTLLDRLLGRNRI